MKKFWVVLKLDTSSTTRYETKEVALKSARDQARSYKGTSPSYVILEAIREIVQGSPKLEDNLPTEYV